MKFIRRQKELEKKLSKEAKKYKKPFSVVNATKILKKVLPLLKTNFILYDGKMKTNGDYVFRHSQIIGNKNIENYFSYHSEGFSK